MASILSALPVEPRQQAPAIQAIPAPVSPIEAFRSNLEAQVQLYNTDARQERARQDLMARHRDIERRVGKALPWSAFMQAGEPEAAGGAADDDLGFNPGVETLQRQLGLRPAGALDEASYEAQIDKLREQHPDALRGVKTRSELDAERDRQFRGLARRAGDTAQGAPVSAFAGSVAGGLLDAPNLVAGWLTGGVGASRGIATRVLMQGGVNAAQEAAMTPGRISDARFGGPKPTVGEIAGNVAAAGVGGAAFELGGSALAAGLRRIAPPRETAQARAVEILEDIERMEVAVGPRDGESFDAATAALARGEDPRAAVAELRAEPPPARVIDSAGAEHVALGEPLPGRGLVVANLMEDGTVYLGAPRELHFQVMERFPGREGNEIAATGFVSPDGRFLDRKEAAEWVRQFERPVTASENMNGDLDAIDYREQVPASAQYAPPAAAPPAVVAPTRSPLEAEVLKTLAAKPGRLEALARQGDAIEAAGGGLAATPQEAGAAVETVALEVLRRGDRGVAKALAGAQEKLAAGASLADVAPSVAKAVRAAARQAERMEAARAAAIDPPATPPAARAQVEPFDDPFGPAAQRQLAAKPEEAEFEGGKAPAGLFDDLAPVDAYDRAHVALKACAPG